MPDLSPEAIEEARAALGAKPMATAPNSTPAPKAVAVVPEETSGHIDALLANRPRDFSHQLASTYLQNEVTAGRIKPEELRDAASRGQAPAAGVVIDASVPTGQPPGAEHIERLLASRDGDFAKKLAGAYLENEVKSGRMTHQQIAEAAARPPPMPKPRDPASVERAAPTTTTIAVMPVGPKART